MVKWLPPKQWRERWDDMTDMWMVAKSCTKRMVDTLKIMGCLPSINWKIKVVPSGKHTKNHGTSPFLMGKFTISMAIFNSYVKLPEGNICDVRDWDKCSIQLLLAISNMDVHDCERLGTIMNGDITWCNCTCQWICFNKKPQPRASRQFREGALVTWNRGVNPLWINE